MFSRLRFCNIRGLTVEELFTGPRLHSGVCRPRTPTWDILKVHRLTDLDYQQSLEPKRTAQ